MWQEWFKTPKTPYDLQELVNDLSYDRDLSFDTDRDLDWEEWGEWEEEEGEEEGEKGLSG